MESSKENQHLDTFGNYAYSSANTLPRTAALWVRSHVCIYVLAVFVGRRPSWAGCRFVSRVRLGPSSSDGLHLRSQVLVSDCSWGHNVLLSCLFTCTRSGRVVFWGRANQPCRWSRSGDESSIGNNDLKRITGTTKIHLLRYSTVQLFNRSIGLLEVLLSFSPSCCVPRFMSIVDLTVVCGPASLICQFLTQTFYTLG